MQASMLAWSLLPDTSKCLYFKLLPSNVGGLSQMRALSCHTDATMRLLPHPLPMQPTVEDLGCNSGFQNAPLMTVGARSE